jgi:hypothetical protein
MFSGSFAKKNNWVRRRGEAFGMNTKGEPAYYKDQVKGKKFELPGSYSEKVARDRGSEHQKSSNHISNKQRTPQEAPEPPSAVRSRAKTTAKTSRTDPERDYHAPSTQRLPSKARNKHKNKSNTASTASATQEHIPKAFSAPPSRKVSSVVSSRASSSRSRSTASHLPDDVEHNSRSRRSRAPSEINDRQSSSRHRSEHRDRSRASSAYEHEEEDEGFEEEVFDEEGYIYDEVHPNDSVTSVGQARVKESHLNPYTQSAVGLGTNRKGFPKYVPHKRSSYTQNEKHASYKTQRVVPAWVCEERTVDAARSVF